MGWIDVLTDTVKGLRATGKNEKEIKAIVEQAEHHLRQQSAGNQTTGERCTDCL